MFSLRRDVFPVDTHVHRLCRRLGFVPPSASAEKTQALMAGLVPRGRAMEFHINLIRHGRRVCQAIRPRCAACVLARLCPSAGWYSRPMDDTGGHGPGRVETAAA
jgi:endonuclease-3